MTSQEILTYCSLILNVAAVIALFVKPVREKLFGFHDFREGQKCLLRSAMLAIYYRCKDEGNKIRQYDFENFALLYAAYKAEGGNTFVDKIKEEVFDMEVVS